MRKGCLIAAAALSAASLFALLCVAMSATAPGSGALFPTALAAATGPARAFADGRIEIDGLWRGRVRGPVQDVALSPDGRQAAVAAADLSLLSATGLRLLGRPGAHYAGVAWGPEAGRLVVVTSRGAVQLYAPAAGQLLWEHCCTSPYGDARFSPDGGRIVFAGHRPAILDARTGTLLSRLTVEREPFANGAVAFLSWDVVAIGNQAGLIRLWQLSTGRQLAAGQVGRQPVELLAAHPRLPLLVAASRRGAPLAWNYRTGRVWSIPGARRVTALVFSADGASLEITSARGWQAIPTPALDPRLTGGPAVLATGPAAPDPRRPSPLSPARARFRPAA